MSHQVPRAPRVVPMTIAAMFAGVMAPSSGQELTPTAPGRLAGEVDSRIVPQAGRRLDELAGERRTEELELAAEMGVDFVTLSPVQPTRTHPGAEVLGWEAEDVTDEE